VTPVPSNIKIRPTERTRVRRRRRLGVLDRAAIDAILDEGLLCHVAFSYAGSPVVIPTLYARDGDILYLHGSTASRMLRTLTAGVDMCLTVTLLDGLVLARSSFHHSANYRSVVVLGRATPVEGGAKVTALRALSEHVVPGRWNEVRHPNARELRATTVLALPLEDEAFYIDTGAVREADTSRVVVFAVDPTTAFGFGRGELFSQTRWRSQASPTATRS
jgi:nitroimidazol reductase NimA-like FMN-containing flavoprotein (pyridoxamine 5'-phosphate oxidase superfamily)